MTNKEIYKRLPDRFSITIKKSDGEFVAIGSKEMAGLFTDGKNIKDLFMMLEDAIRVYLHD